MAVYGQNNRWLCFKHGDIKPDTGESILDVICPICKDVQKRDLCQDCELHKATINFSGSALESVHGMSERLCRCCYLARVAETKARVNENYERLKKELQLAPCGE